MFKSFSHWGEADAAGTQRDSECVEITKPTQGVLIDRGSTRHDEDMTILEKVEWCY
jgi:hypothetical protein